MAPRLQAIVSGGAGRAPSHILRRTASRPDMHYHLFDTEMGLAGIGWSDDGIITRFRLPDPDRASAEKQFKGEAKSGNPPSGVAAVVAQAKRYFAGERIDFTAIELDLARVDPFRRTIYEALRKVSFGETVTYGELAKRAGANAPTAAQDVGVAMARNPVPLIIPCHRVLAAGGKLGGFSAPGRTEAKQRMLALEGVFVGNQPRLL
jgi:methylated-DNA-[protein]-cysteine S-methyltransferase